MELVTSVGVVVEVEETEIIELEPKRFIQLAKYRQWPKVGILWSVRQRAGDSDYPLQTGTMDRLLKSGQNADEVWDSLREEALGAAHDAAGAAVPTAGEGKRPSFLGRLFGRQ